MNNSINYWYQKYLKEKKKNEGMIEALRTEYEKGRADIIQATEHWLANSWPKYCENPNIIDDYKEAIKE